MMTFDILILANIIFGVIIFIMEIIMTMRDKGMERVTDLAQGLSALWFSFLYIDVSFNHSITGCTDTITFGLLFIRPAVTILLASIIGRQMYRIRIIRLK